MLYDKQKSYKPYEPKFSVLKGSEAEKIAMKKKKHAEICIFLSVHFDRLFALPEADGNDYISCDEYPPKKGNLRFFKTKEEVLDFIKKREVRCSTFVYRNDDKITFML